MRKLLGDILILLLCITLMVNFGRFFFLPQGDEYQTVDVFSVLDAIHEFDVDPTPLYSALGQALGTTAGVAQRMASVFKLNWTSVEGVLESLFNILTAGFDIVYNVGVVLAELAVVVYRFLLYFVDLFNAFMTLINKLLGAVFNTTKVATISGFRGNSTGGGGYAGGGLGGRR